MEGLFFQKIGDLDLSYLKLGNFVETIDLSGPRLILRMADDPAGRAKSVRPGDTLDVVFSDRWAADGINLSMKFSVMGVITERGEDARDVLVIECLQKQLADAKKETVRSMLFSKKPIPMIMSRLMPGFDGYDVDDLPASTFHCLSPQRPSQTARRIARELACFVFSLRGRLTVAEMEKVAKKAPDMRFTHGDMQTPERGKILSYRRLDDAVLPAAVKRNRTGFDIVKGRVESGGDRPKAPGTAPPVVRALKNLGVRWMPVLDFMTYGNGEIAPGKKAKITWATMDPARPSDDSLPGEVIVLMVVHQYAAQSYVSFVTGGVVL